MLRGDTIPAAFVEYALARPKDIVVADDLAGLLTGERLLVGVLTLSRRLRDIAGANIGVLLPASAACDMVLLALHLAGKAAGCVELDDRPGQPRPRGAIVGTLPCRDLPGVCRPSGRQGRGDQLPVPGGRSSPPSASSSCCGRSCAVRWLPGSVRRLVPAVSPDRPAVVLFTSGSEKAPKAVPLTHANLLNNQSGLAVLGCD